MAFFMEMDLMFGQMAEHIKENGLKENDMEKYVFRWNLK